jgi:hypothetical protein
MVATIGEVVFSVCVLVAAVLGAVDAPHFYQVINFVVAVIAIRLSDRSKKIGLFTVIIGTMLILGVVDLVARVIANLVR